MNQFQKLRASLKKKKRQLVNNLKRNSNHLSPEELMKQQCKIKFISSKIDHLKTHRRKSDSKLFISYSKASSHLFQIVKRIAEENFEFQVVTGFDEPPDSDADSQFVLAHVLNQIRYSSCFLCLMTPDNNIHIPEGKGSRPSIWVVEEKGMALAYGKPFHLLIHESIHEDFYLKTGGEKKHTFFNDNNFESKVFDAIDILEDKNHQAIMTAIREQET